MAAQTDRRFLVSLIVGFAFFMYLLDSTIVTTALPQMAVSFGESPIHLSIAIVAYVVSLAVFIPISGWVADRFGASIVFRAAILIFTIGSICCAISGTLTELALSRVLQAMGGAMVVPVGRLLVLRNAAKSEFIKALAMLGLIAQAGPMLGPPVGGFITTYASWRWIFLINVPIGVVGFVLVTIYVQNFRETERRPLDWVGFVLAGIALSCIVYGLEAIGRGTAEWGSVLALTALGITVGYFAVRHLLRHPHPLLDLRLTELPTFRMNMLGGSPFRIAAGGMPFLLPLLFQTVFHMTAFVSGLLIVSNAIGALSVRIVVQRILRRFGFRGGLSVTAILYICVLIGCCFLDARTPAYVTVLLMGAMGFCQGFQFTSLNTLAYSDVAAPRISAATSLAQLAQQLSQGVGVAVAASLLHAAMTLRGGTALSRHDFLIAFVGLAIITLSSGLMFRGMADDAGAEITGYRSHADHSGLSD
jgi:EmrB/QacA subfamily drug resistance transporter